jgi:hypothetical protein
VQINLWRFRKIKKKMPQSNYNNHKRKKTLLKNNKIVKNFLYKILKTNEKKGIRKKILLYRKILLKIILI